MKVRCIENRAFISEDEQGNLHFGPVETASTDLTPGSIYEVLSVEYYFYRVVDDNGEDYLFPAYMFEPLEEQEVDSSFSHLFPVKFGTRLKAAGIQLNDPVLGAWWILIPHPALEQAYNEDWEQFFKCYDEMQGSSTPNEVREFAKFLAQKHEI